jgi:hypothetical protein
VKVVLWQREDYINYFIINYKLSGTRQILIKVKMNEAQILTLWYWVEWPNWACPYLTDVAVEGMIRLHWRWWDIIGAPPNLYLGLTMLCSSFCFIEASETPIVPLIEAPSPHHWQPHLVNGIQHCPEGPDCSFLHWGEADVKFIASIWRLKVPRDKLIRSPKPEFFHT